MLCLQCPADQLRSLPFSGQSVTIQMPPAVAKQQLQQALEAVVREGCWPDDKQLSSPFAWDMCLTVGQRCFMCHRWAAALCVGLCMHQRR